MNYATESLRKHQEWRGKIEVTCRAPLETREDLSLAYTPCVAAIAAVKRELGGGRAALGVVLMQCGIAWVVAFAVHCVGVLLGLA